MLNPDDFKVGDEKNSFELRLNDSQENLKKELLKNGYGNINSFDDLKTFSPYHTFNNWLFWLSLYQESWVFKKAIDTPSQDIINLPLILHGIKKPSELLTTYKSLKPQLIELLCWGFLFGGAIALMVFDNIKLQEMNEPLNYEKLKQTQNIKLIVFNRWDLNNTQQELITDINNPEFLKPQYYEVRINQEVIKIHSDYVLRYEHRVAPNIIKNGVLMGWGYPEGAHIINELMRDEKIKDMICDLMRKSLIEVIKMSGMRGVFMGSDIDNEKQLRKRLEMVNWGRDYNSLTFLDKEDEYSQNSFSGLSGLSQLLDKNMQYIAASLNMSGVLFGDLSGGFSRDNYALNRYDNHIRNLAENYYRKPLEKLLKTICSMKGITDKWTIDFDTMIQLTEDKKWQQFNQFIDNLSRMINDGYLTADKAAQEVQKKAIEYGIGESIDDQYIKELKKLDEEF